MGHPQSQKDEGQSACERWAAAGAGSIGPLVTPSPALPRVVRPAEGEQPHGSGRRGVLPEHKQLHPRSRLSLLYSPLSRLRCSLSCTSPQSGHRQPCVHVANVTWVIPFLRVLSLLQESRVLRNCAPHVCLLSVSCLPRIRFTIFSTPQRALLSAAPATPRINGRSPPRCAHAVPKRPGVDSRFSVRVSSGLHWFRIDCAPRAQTPSATSHPPRPTTALSVAHPFADAVELSDCLRPAMDLVTRVQGTTLRTPRTVTTRDLERAHTRPGRTAVYPALLAWSVSERCFDEEARCVRMPTSEPHLLYLVLVSSGRGLCSRPRLFLYRHCHLLSSSFTAVHAFPLFSISSPSSPPHTRSPTLALVEDIHSFA